MARSTKSKSIRAIADSKADDYVWGVPESPESSVLQTLIDEFRTHEIDERRWIAIYRKLADQQDQPLFGFLMNLILADEERHREIIEQVVSGLRDELTSVRTVPAEVERRGRDRYRKELAQTIDQLLRVERDGIAEYERLTKISGRVHQDLLALLCKSIVHDSLKHISILDFLRQKLNEPRARKRKNMPKA